MIDPLKETLILPHEARSVYPRRRDGKPVHVSRVYRDMKEGRDGIVLESLRTPRLTTSREAVARFFQRLTEAACRPTATPRRPRPVAGCQPARDVDRELDRFGI